MTDELYVLNEGVYHSDNTSIPSAYNTNTSINPILWTINGTSGTSYLNSYEIHDIDVLTGRIVGEYMAADMALSGSILNRAYPKSTTVIDYGENLIETPGHRIVVDLGIEGYTSGSPLVMDLTTNDYFVVINADETNLHHVAKITDTSVYDGNKTNIDFTPALKENVASGIKISIYKGAIISGGSANVSSLVAVGYGLRGGLGSTRNGGYVEVNTPKFYFYRDLEPDRKYVALKRTNVVTTKVSVFKTAPVTSNVIGESPTGSFIIDKSFYSQNAYIVDNNKIGDEAATPVNYAQYDGTTGNYTLDITGWSTSAKNYDFAMGSSTTTYPTYIRPVTSPVKNQYMGHIMGTNLNRSITNKGNMAEVKFIDSERMLERKINDYENFNIKEVLGKETMAYKPQAVLPGIYNGSGSTITVTGLEEGVDLKDLLGSSANFELIYIGDYYYKLSAISAVSGGEQTLTVSDRRLFSDFKFEGSSTVATMTNATAYRNIWSSKVNNLIVTHDIDTVIDSGTLKRSGITLENTESDINGIEYIVAGEGIILTAKRGDELANYIELEDNKASNYLTNHSMLDSIKGELVVNKKVFKGKVEFIETDTEGGIFNLTISGRDEIATLLDYPINKNFLYSKEWIASTISPVTDTFTDTGLNIVTNNSAEQLNQDRVLVSGSLSIDIAYGDVLYVKYNNKYIPLGVAAENKDSGTSLSQVNLLNDLLIDPHTDFDGTDTLDTTDIYVGKNKLLAGKSLHNHYRNTPHVSLYGAADKGMVFYGTGSTLTKATSGQITDGVSIVSLNDPDTNNTKNYGMEISGIHALEGSSGSPKDSPYGLDFDYITVNSLSNMHLIGSPISIDDNITNLEIGNVSPIVMARMDRNDTAGYTGSYTLDTFYSNSIGLYFLNTQGIDRGGFIHLLDNNNDSHNFKASTWRRLITEDRNTPGITNNYSFRFGSPIFRYSNLSDTRLKYWKMIQDHRRTNVVRKEQPNPFYFDKPAQFIAYASALRVSGNEVIDKDYNRDQSSSHLKELPIEQSWQYPVSGSGHIDIRIKDNNIHGSGHDYYKFIKNKDIIKTDKNFMEMDDPMCNTYFLFAPGDMLPDSQKRPDHIFNNNTSSSTDYHAKNTSDYFLMIKYKDTISNTSISHDMYKGKTKFTLPSDNNYDLLPINNNLDSIPKRFNLMRLKAMTLDSYMNEVDYETYPIGGGSSSGQDKGGTLSNKREILVKSIPDMGYSVYEVSTTSATASNSKNIQVTTTVPFFDVGSPNTQSRLAFDNDWYSSGSYETGGSSANPSLKVYTNPDDDSGSDTPRLLGTIDMANSDIDTIVLVDNCEINGYSGKIFTQEQETNNGFLTRTGVLADDILRNKNSHRYPDRYTRKEGNNHNIHRTCDSPYITSGDLILFNYSSYALYRNTRNFKHKGNIKIVDSDNSGSDNICKIEFEPLTYNSGADNVVVDLSNFAVGDQVRLSGTSESIMNNETYQITAINGTSDSPRQITVYRVTNASDNCVNTGSYEANALIENVSKYTQISCHVNNFINSILFSSYKVGGVGRQDLGAFNYLRCVLVNAGGSTYADRNSEKGISRKKDRGNLFTKNDFTNNYMDLIGSDGGSADIGAYIYREENGGFPNAVGGSKVELFDLITLRTKGEWIYDNNDTTGDHAADDIEALFIPILSTNAGNITKIDGVRSGKYTDEAYLRIETAMHPDIDGWNTGGYLNWINHCPNLTGKFLVSTYTNQFFRILSHTISKNESTGSDEGKAIHYLHIDGNKPNFTDNTCDLSNNSPIVTCDANTNIKLHQEVTYSSSGIPEYTKIISITESGGAGTGVTSFTLSNDFTGSTASNQTLTFNTLGTEKLMVCNLATATMQEDKLNYPLYSFSGGNVINPKTGKFFKNDYNQYAWGGWTVGSDSETLKLYETTGDPHRGGVRAMFVVAELDGSGSPTLIHRDTNSLFSSNVGTTIYNQFEHNEEVTVYLTDGKNSIKSVMIPRFDFVYPDENKTVILDFSETAKLDGSVSIGETFGLSVQGNIKGDVEYVKIVTPFNIVPEVEQVIDQIMSENNISYTTHDNTNKYYAGNNFTGQDSYTASNILLANKDLKLSINGDDIKVVSNEDSKDFRAIEISEENTTVKVVQIKKDKSLLDNYNEVIVYGDGHKGVARNYSNIKKKGKVKTKEIFDYSIITQAEVDKKAIKTLQLYSSAQNAIELSIANDLPFLEPGNIVTVYYPSEGIRRGHYAVIEIEKTLGMPTKLLLGQYNKDLSNTLSGLLSVTKDLQGNTKRKTYASVYVPNVSVQTTKFKFIQAKVTSNTGTPAIGFTYTIGFDAGIEP